VNKVVHPESVRIECDNYDESPLPDTLRRLATNPGVPAQGRPTVLTCTPGSPTCTPAPHNQTAQQLRLTIEAVKEHQEGELINSPEYGC